MIRRVVSGGQTGCDLGGLRAARSLGIETGGHAALGWLIETPDGRGEQSAPWLAEFGLVECDEPGYAARRRKNVRHSDGTLLLGRETSHGAMGLMRDCTKACKPYYHVKSGETRPSDVLPWLDEYKITTLNIAGNRESSDPGIGARAERFCREVFRLDMRRFRGPEDYPGRDLVELVKDHGNGWTNIYCTASRPILMTETVGGELNGGREPGRKYFTGTGDVLRVVMASRLGDVGVTDSLGKDMNYKARVFPDGLEIEDIRRGPYKS